MSKLSELITKLSDVKSALKKDAREMLLDYFKENLPQCVSAVRWAQYTPYFNDGEACVFGIQDASYIVDGINTRGGGWEEADENDDGFFVQTSEWSIRHYGYTKTSKHTDVMTFDSLFQAVPAEVYEFAFGDHAEITIKRDGDSLEVKVDSYSHD